MQGYIQMKAHRIENTRYKQYEAGFKEWLATLGYSHHQVYNLPLFLREFFHYLERKQINSLDQLSGKEITDYITHLKQRKKARTTGTLSNYSINNQVYMLEKFSEYLQKEYGQMLTVNATREQISGKIKIIVTPGEVQSLYKATDSTPLGLRDMAMLSLYYGCGLRRSEGIGLQTDDIRFDKNLVHVRKSKNFKERLVPMTWSICISVQNYLDYGRPILEKNVSEKAFFINRRGGRVTGGQLYARFKRLLITSGIYDHKPGAGLHTLRHSIATHLLQAGMKLEDISRFLGHRSLESTQIYTHIIHESC